MNGQIAIEVKETPSASDQQTLARRAEAVGLQHTWLVGRHAPENGFSKWTWGGNLF